MSASCEVRTTGEGDAAITTSTLTFDLGSYTRPITLALSLWDRTHYRSLKSLGLAMPEFQRDGQTATVEVVTDPSKTRFRIDGQYGLNLGIGLCRLPHGRPVGVEVRPSFAATAGFRNAPGRGARPCAPTLYGSQRHCNHAAP